MHRLITTTEALKTLCEKLAAEPYVTVDTEFVREKTYYPKLCLVQIAGVESEAAIDPLAEGMDLSPLFDLLKNEKVLKVFHAPKQDNEIFFKLMKCVPAPLYDTQVAAMVCGYGEQVGYEALVNTILNQSLDKASRYTDWEQRPLTQRQIDYAISDVTYLRRVYESLSGEIAAKGRQEWIADEMAELMKPSLYEVNPDECWRKLKYKNRTPAHLNLLRAIAAWRERSAQRKDVPRGRLLKDEIILQIAAMAPENMEDLAQVRGALRHISADNAKSLLAAMNEARTLPRESWPRDEKKKQMLTPEQDVLVDMLKLLLKFECETRGVASKIVGGKEDLATLVLAQDRSVLPIMQGWRYELFGRKASAFLEGKLFLGVGGSGAVTFKE